MSNTYKPGPQGVRSDRWSGSKATNRTAFRPFTGIAEQLYSKLEDRIYRSVWPFVHVEPTHDSFIFPLTEDDIYKRLSELPSEHLEGLIAVLVVSGTKKMYTSYTNAFVGSYYNRVVYLYPLPKDFLRLVFHKTPNPEDLRIFSRAGGTVERIGSETVVRLTPEAIREYYLYDILTHEVGHHYDRVHRGSTQRDRENYAEWYATEFGFRLRKST